MRNVIRQILIGVTAIVLGLQIGLNEELLNSSLTLSLLGFILLTGLFELVIRKINKWIDEKDPKGGDQ